MQVVESDKADMDVESFSEGILGAIVGGEGGVAGVGAPIAYVAETEADLDAAMAKEVEGALGGFLKKGEKVLITYKVSSLSLP